MNYHKLTSTYSIVARGPETGELGVAVQTHHMAVGQIVPWTLPGVGAIATQSLINVSFGPMGLAMLGQGVPAPKVVEALVASDAQPQVRQLAVVDAHGRVGAWTGEGCIPEAGHHIGDGYSVQANMMLTDRVVGAMSAAYETAGGDLAARLMASLFAAQEEGGDIRGMQSAALKVVEGDPAGMARYHDWDSIYDLRVEDHEHPLRELGRLVRLQRAWNLAEKGDEAMEKGERERGMRLLSQARAEAPELEELAFWQALSLADNHEDVATAVEILGPVLAADPRRSQWLELIRRLQACGIIERPGAGDELLAALVGEG